MTTPDSLAQTKGRGVRWPGSVLAVPPLRPRAALTRRQVLTETWLVLLVSLGASAVWSTISLLRKALEARAAHLLGRSMRNPLGFIGLDGTRKGPDAVLGALLAAVIGLPGLALYLGARAAGLNTTVVASGLSDHWWVVPVLVLAAVQNALLEEVVMVGYLFTRWSQAGWGRTKVIVVSALIRGGYHLYQGIGGFVGNVVMGLVFGWLYTRTRRVMPLVVAHTILDIVSFVGYALLKPHVSWL